MNNCHTKFIKSVRQWQPPKQETPKAARLFNTDPAALEKKIAEYFEQFRPPASALEMKPAPALNEWRPTITGMVLFCGFVNRQSFYDYEAKPEFAGIIKKGRCLVENVYEQNLTGTTPTGSIFALKNMGWRDEQSINLNDERKAIAALFPDELKEGYEDEKDSKPESNAPN